MKGYLMVENVDKPSPELSKSNWTLADASFDLAESKSTWALIKRFY